MLKSLELKIPPAIVFLVCLLLIWEIAVKGIRFPIQLETRFWLSLSLIFTGGYFGLVGIYNFRKAGTTIHPMKTENVSALVTSGVYRYSRNPMYLGLALILLAASVYLASPVSLFGVALFVVYLTKFQIIPEEQAVEKQFGDDFLNYKKQVRRWV